MARQGDRGQAGFSEGAAADFGQAFRQGDPGEVVVSVKRVVVDLLYAFGKGDVRQA